MSPDTKPTKLRKLLLAATVLAVALLVPLVAVAIPGSGEFVAMESGSGREITELYNTIAKICLFILLVVEGVLIVALIRFRRRSEDEQPEQVHGNMKLELGWTLAAVVLQVYIGFITIDVMFDVEAERDTEMTIEAIAYQWDWEFRYPDQGGLVHKDLVIPANTDIRLEVTSRDVIHSIFIPELGVKIDAVPGRFNYWWFNADGPVSSRAERSQRQIQEADVAKRVTTRPDWWSYFTGNMPGYEDRFYSEDEQTPPGGLERRVNYLADSRDADTTEYSKYSAIEYRGMCTELCGRDHWDMYFRTVAMTESDFEKWVEDQQTGDQEVDGEQIYSSTCATCHGDDGKGEPGTYPPLVDTRFTTDEDRKREHIEIVLNGLEGEIEVQGETYDGVMQSFDSLNDAEVAAVINHERTSWGNDGGEVDEEMVAEVREESGLDPFPAGGAEPVPEDELMEVGEGVYSACASCHGDDGQGVEGAVPALAENTTVLGDVEESVRILQQGVDTDDWPGRQPPMGKQMSDRQLAGVLTYVRNSFGNEASAVQPEEVKRIRQDSN
ncbi:MAG: cytochrome c oxidase subunit II [Persicimonas sp.]